MGVQIAASKPGRGRRQGGRYGVASAARRVHGRRANGGRRLAAPIIVTAATHGPITEAGVSEEETAVVFTAMRGAT